MQMSIVELLFLASSVIILPVIAVLTMTFLSGGLTKTEDAKFTMLLEPEADYWALTDPNTDAGHASASLP
jgi:Sec-independent protein secretion pathway component TatC